MFCVDIVAHQNLIQFSMVAKNLQLVDSLRIRRHIKFFIHHEVGALKAEEVVLAEAAQI